MALFKKYSFLDEAQVDELINSLWDNVNLTVNPINIKGNTICKIGQIVDVPAVIDEEGNETQQAVYNLDFAVDVLWIDDIPVEWDAYEIQLTHEGVHGFPGHKYI